MRFALCNEMFESWPLADAMHAIAGAGYDGVELAPFTLGADPQQVTPSETASVKRAVEAAGLEVAGLHWLLAKTQGLHLTSPDRAVREATIEALKDRVRLCAELGGRVLVFGSPQQRSLLPGVTREDAGRYAAQALQEVGECAGEHGVMFCLEPLAPNETDFINTADEAWNLVAGVASPSVRLVLDVKAMSSEPRPVPETIRAHIAHAGHFHANDPNLRGPGFGDEDFVPIMRALNEAHYDHIVSVEVFDFRPDPITIAERSLEYLRMCLSKGTADG